MASQSRGREFESRRRLNFFLFFFCLLINRYTETFTETERLPFRYVKKHLPKQCLLSKIKVCWPCSSTKLSQVSDRIAKGK